MNNKERREFEYKCYGREDLLMIERMCKDCKFYEDRCTKNRTLRECSVKYLKNKD